MEFDKHPAPKVSDESLRAALLACFEKYRTFALSAGQIVAVVAGPTPEVLLALDDLIVAGQVREVSPGRFKLVAADGDGPSEPMEPRPRKITVTSDGVLVDGKLAPPDEPESGYPLDRRAELLSNWAKADALRTVRTKGIVAKTLDRGIRRCVAARLANERGIEDFVSDNLNLVRDSDLLSVDQVAQAHLDQRESEITSVREWAAEHPDREARLPPHMTIEEARSIVEEAATKGDVLLEAHAAACVRFAYLERRGLDDVWSFARSAESLLPRGNISSQDRLRARRLWDIGRAVLGWALRIEAGQGSEPFQTSGGRPVTADGHKKTPRQRKPVSVAHFADQFLDQVDGLNVIESADSMNRDEVVAEVKPLLARLLRMAKRLNRAWSEKLRSDGKHKRESTIREALAASVAALGLLRGRVLRDADREDLLEGFPAIESTPWVQRWTAWITGATADQVKQVAASRLRAGPAPKPHNPPPAIRDKDGKIVGYARGPNPLERLEMEVRVRIAEATMKKRADTAMKKRQTAERAASAKARKAQRTKRRLIF